MKRRATLQTAIPPEVYEEFLPDSLRNIDFTQTLIPRIAKDVASTQQIEDSVRRIPTSHNLYLGDSRDCGFLADSSIHLIVTSPPYWKLKEYLPDSGQLGHILDYEGFLQELDRVWHECARVLVPGGRLVCVVGDVCLSRRKNGGIHEVVPLHASIQERCRKLGLTNLAPIIWNKISNAAHEADGNGGGFLGKPYEPNAVVKNDIEFILMERKPGGYRSPSISARILSLISAENHGVWFQQVWTGLTGASTRNHPAPFPIELAERLVRMFSFVGDTVLDPFMGTGTTSLACARWGRHSVGIELNEDYFSFAATRLARESANLFATHTVSRHVGSR